MLKSFSFTNFAFAVAHLEQVSARQRPTIGHGFTVDFSLDGMKHVRNRDGVRTKKVNSQ